MVIGERFAWGHLPKTGGEATRAMFSHVPELVRFSDPPGTLEQHKTFVERRDQVEGKVLALNIRRLPAWILSREQHRSRWGVHPENRPMPMPSPAEMATSTVPDERLGAFMAGGLDVDRWLRTEHIVDDFLAFVSEFIDMPAELADRIRGIGRINFNVYTRSLDDWFTADQVEELYECNPRWRDVEERVYGGLALPR
jgi:hypothetical protein